MAETEQYLAICLPFFAKPAISRPLVVHLCTWVKSKTRTSHQGWAGAGSKMNVWTKWKENYWLETLLIYRYFFLHGVLQHLCTCPILPKSSTQYLHMYPRLVIASSSSWYCGYLSWNACFMYRSKRQLTSCTSTSLWSVSTKTTLGVLGMWANTSMAETNHAGNTLVSLYLTTLAGKIFCTASDTMSTVRSWWAIYRFLYEWHSLVMRSRQIVFGG